MRNRPNSQMTPDQREAMETVPAAADAYAAGYQVGRLHSLARIADVAVWTQLTSYALGYRHGWYVEGRPT